MIEVSVVPNALDPSAGETTTVPALLPWLAERFRPRWPRTARLYQRVGSHEHDVTPETPADVAALERMPGPFVVRIFPAGLDPLLGIGGMVIGAIKLIDWILPETPNIKTPEQRAKQQLGGSPNNGLGARSNEARPGQRIPYIVGGVDAVPDLLAVPYTIYVDHIEHEIAYYCVGVGSHAVQSLRDGDSLISQIQGASAQVYQPGKAPTDGPSNHDPDEDWSVGDPIDDDVYNVYTVEAVNGQEVHGFSDYTCYGSSFPVNNSFEVQSVYFDNGDGTGIIRLAYNSAPDEVTDRISVGDELFLFWPMDHIPPGGVGTPPDLNTPVTSTGEEPVEVTGLTVVSLFEDPDIARVDVTVNIPVGQQAEWALIQPYFEDLQDPGGLFPYIGATFPYAQVTPLKDNLYVGPFFIDFEHPVGSNEFEVVCNFVAPRGLFADDGVTVRALDVQMQVILTPADSSGNPVGDSEAFSGTLEGSQTARGLRALTLRCKPTGFGGVTRCLVRARRLTNSLRRWRQIDEVEEEFYGADLDADPPIFAHFSGTVVDEIRWTHCYSMSKPPNISFGDVTTIHTRTINTPGAVRVKNRQLNCFAFRKIQTWNGTSFGGSAVANNAVENILFTLAKDQYVGNLPDASIDFEGIVAAMEAVRASVFSASDLATKFGYTFDDSDLSFEETFQAVCQAAFCTAFRRGNVLSVRPELAGDDSVLVFNHRNMLSGTQKITHAFGPPTENDSVEVSFKDPSDDSTTKVTVPVDGSALRPKQLAVIGVQSEVHAYWHAYRAYQKMLYQRQSVTLEATQEAHIVGARERVLIADRTRSSTQDGEIVAFSGATVQTSQPVALEGGRSYTLFLQRIDGSVEAIAVESAPTARTLELASAPTDDPITDPNLGVRTLYQLVADDEPTPRAYLVSSTRPTTPMTHQVEAVNYSHMYYLADGLGMWVDFSAGGLIDRSPLRHLLTNNGGTVNSGTWNGEFGDSFEVHADDPFSDAATGSYTRALWINGALPTHSGLIQSAGSTNEEFAITADGTLVAGHDGDLDVAFDFSDLLGAEHFVALSYDGETDRMALFVDGALVDEASVSASSGAAALVYLNDFEGTCRMLLNWHRALSDRAVMELYLRTRP